MLLSTLTTHTQHITQRSQHVYSVQRLPRSVNMSPFIAGFILMLMSSHGHSMLLYGALMDFLQGMTSQGQPTYPVLPEATLDTMGIIEYYGYQGESHDVVTSDGYIIQIHRLRLAKCKQASYEGDGGHPVLVQHGILTSSSSWIINGQRDSLGFVLADACYDVWLGNIRGNRYARRHTRLSPDDDDAFWDYSLDEHALLDVPAVIDYILHVTCRPRLSLVAHSMGTTMTLLMLAAKPHYNQKVDAAILQSPVMFGRFLKNPLRVILNHIDEFTKLVNEFGLKEVPPVNNPMAQGLIRTMCTEHPLTIACEGVINLIGGYDDDLLDKRRMHVYFAHFDSSSWTIGRHFSQVLTRHPSPKRYDMGPSRNMAKYGQVEPPAYNLSQVTVPIAMFHGYMDLYVDRKDLQRLAGQLSNVKLLEEVDHELWAHQDFLLAIDAAKHHHRRMLQVLWSLRNPT